MGDCARTKPETPFPKHWRYDVAIEWLLIAGALVLALNVFGAWWARWDRRCRNLALRPFPAGGYAACWRRSSPPVDRGTDRGRLQRGAAGGVGQRRRRTKRRSASGSRGQLTLVATLQKSPVGFAALKERRPDRPALRAPGRGGAGRRRRCCVEALEKLAGGRGAKKPHGRCQRHRGRNSLAKRGYVADAAQHRDRSTANGSPTPRCRRRWRTVRRREFPNEPRTPHLVPTALSLRSLPPCGGGLGRGVAAHRDLRRVSFPGAAPRRRPPPHGGGDNKERPS